MRRQKWSHELRNTGQANNKPNILDAFEQIQSLRFTGCIKGLLFIQWVGLAPINDFQWPANTQRIFPKNKCADST